MKKTLKLILIVVVVMTMVMSTALGTGMKKTIEVAFNSINLRVNGKKVDADTILFEGTTYVPLRAAGEMLDKNVGWDSSTKTANINDKVKIEDFVNNTSNKDDLNKLKLYSKITDHYMQLKDYGDILWSTENNLSVGLTGLTAFNDPSSMEVFSVYFDERIQWYNNLLTPTENIIYEAQLVGIDLSDMNIILNDYYKAIDEYKLAFDLISNYYNYNDKDSYDKNFDARKKASDLIMNSSAEAFEKYLEFFNKIQQL